MSRIAVLPETVANRIAAGEVVERPAAVVKELLENSLDAGATRVEVRYLEGGKRYLAVEDNGHGMDEADTALCLQRHATSKIRSADDLESILSFGFRGEALPSIASVSRFRLRSRQAEHEGGSEVRVEAGRLVHQKACGMPPGTQIEVEDLFYSVPARRKFLKTDRTETQHIAQLVRLYALAHPQISFRLSEGSRTVFESPSQQDLRARLAEVWSRELAEDMLEIEPVEEGAYRLHGLIGKPGSGRGSRQHMRFFIHARPVEDRTLSFAVRDAYDSLLPKGRYPAAFLFLEVPPAEIDVNVHPAKREVRFRSEGRIRQFLMRALRERLEQFNRELWPSESPSELETAAATKALVEEMVRPRREPKAYKAPEPASAESQVEEEPSVPTSQPASPPVSSPRPTRPVVPVPVSSAPKPAPASRPPWRFLSLLRGPRLYALYQAEDGLVILDCRAAHERVQYERILAQEGEGNISQPLLVPLRLALEVDTVPLLESALEFLRERGFEIEPFGGRDFRIEAVPAWLEPARVEAFLRDVLDEIRERALVPESGAEAGETLARLASRKAVRLSDQLGERELESLLVSLFSCRQPLKNPRGVSTFTELSWRELNKRAERL